MSFEDLDEFGNPIYTRVRVLCQKTKLSPGGRSTTMYIDNRTGRFETDKKVIVDTALRKKILIKPKPKGSWLQPNLDMLDQFPMMTADMKWNGAAKFVEFCEQPENEALLDYILRFRDVQSAKKKSAKKNN